MQQSKRRTAAASRAMKAGARGLVVAGSKPGRTLSDDIALPCPSARASPGSILLARLLARFSMRVRAVRIVREFTEAHGQHSE
jgi:hypothetical protein